MKTGKFIRYGALWADDDTIEIEKSCIAKGGYWRDGNGTLCGKGLFHHYKELWKIWWPEDDEHRWADLILKNYLENQYLTVMGAASSSKTYTVAKIGLTDYACFPDETLTLISSTDVRGLELRVWGALKSLWERAFEHDEHFPGTVIDYLHAVSTQQAGSGQVRDLRQGMICIPCLSDRGQFKGLGRYAGAKNNRVRLFADECQFMSSSFLGAIANLRNNPDFKAVFLGNPLGLGDPLDIVAEPECGWHKHPIPEKTSVWKTRKFRGACVNLIGTDSPNFDHPGEIRFPYLTRPDTIEATLRDYGPNSAEFWSQCKGARITGLIARKVITADLCKQHGAEREPEWLGTMRTKVYAIDAAYGNVGGDRCVAGHIEFGPDPEGNLILYVPRQKIIPIEIGNGVTPEDQIATWVRDDCISLDIPPENVFHDATGRGSLGTSFGRLWSPKVNPVEFGGSASARPVTNDTFMIDPRTGEKRLVLCHEKYANFVTELWYSVRYTIEAGQMRGLPPDVMEEGCLREWVECRGNKIQVEPKKDMKERVGRSPDLFDWLATAIEGARRLGFQISRMIGVFESDPDNFLAKEEEKTQNLIANQQLTFS
ncbi:MAG TPA: hypothetical protein VFU31_21050 [Candidatus Binatia bacterium]|nr:hypothetical protein [Candidatus Binatia bacterium]